MGHGSHGIKRAPNFGRVPPAPKYAVGSAEQLAEFRKATADSVRAARKRYKGVAHLWSHAEWNEIVRNNGRRLLKSVCDYADMKGTRICRTKPSTPNPSSDNSTSATRDGEPE